MAALKMASVKIIRLLLSTAIFLTVALLVIPDARCQSIPDGPARQVSLSGLLKELKLEKQVTFLYEPETIAGVYVPNLPDRKLEVKAILNAVLPPAGLKFRKVGKCNYIIKKGRNWRKSGPAHFNEKPGEPYQKKKISAPAFHNIFGRVTSAEDGQPLEGGAVYLKGEGLGAIIGENGLFHLRLPGGRQTLVFSYLGFEDQEVEINGQHRQDVQLKTTSAALHEVVVTAVGIEANKRVLGYAVDNLSMEDIHYSNQTNLASALSSSSAGLWVNSASGSPGAAASIYIRGMHSIHGSNKPLFILDGVPVDNTTTGNSTQGVDLSNRLIDLNHYDIERATVLKGPAAAALYGIRAANGAIVMSSKKGQIGLPRISFSSSFGFSEVNRLPPRQMIYTQGKYVNGQASYMGPESSVSSSYGPPASTLEYDGDPDYPYDTNGRLVPRGQGNGAPANIYDAYETFFVKGGKMDNHFAISGGMKLFDYYFSFGQLRETGIVPHSAFERYTLKGAFHVRPIDRLEIGMSVNLAHSKGHRMKRGSLVSGIPLGLFRNPISFDIGNGRKGMAAADYPEAYLFDNGQQRAYRGNGLYDNPFWSVSRNPFDDSVNRLIQNVSLDYELTPWLHISHKIGADLYADNRQNIFDINSGSHPNGRIELQDIQSGNINSDLLVTAENEIGASWRLKSTLGYNFFGSSLSTRETLGDELKKQGIYHISNALYTSTQENLFRKKMYGAFADVMLRYKSILYLNFTGRNDWSSTLPRRNNAFFYPGVHVGFEFTELLGWTDGPALSYGKLRLSFTRAGNDAGAYMTDTYYNFAVAGGDDLLPGVEFPAFGVSALERSGISGNPFLEPETSTAYEVGTDLKFFRGRLEVALTGYRTISTGQIVNAQLSATSGYIQMPLNAGAIDNRGIELMAEGTVVRKGGFLWDVSANFSSFRSVATQLPEGMPEIVLASFTNLSSMIIEGQPYGVLVGTAFKRDKEGRKIIGSDGFPMVSSAQQILGDPTPDWLLGIRSRWSWKGFTLSALLDVRKGGDIWNGTRGVMSYIGVSEESGRLREVRGYVFEGVTETGEPNTRAVDLANPVNGMNGIYWRRYGFIGLAEEHVEDGSWVRLRELRLSYQFSPRLFRSSRPDITVSVIGHNVWLATSYSGIDPETNLRGDSNIMGWDYFNLPSTRGWALQLNASF